MTYNLTIPFNTEKCHFCGKEKNFNNKQIHLPYYFLYYSTYKTN